MTPVFLVLLICLSLVVALSLLIPARRVNDAAVLPATVQRGRNPVTAERF